MRAPTVLKRARAWGGVTASLLAAVVATALLAASLSVFHPAGASQAKTPRHEMWVYTYNDTPAQLVAKAHMYGVTDLLVWVSPRFASEPTKMAYLKSLAAATTVAHIKMEALCGDVSWLANPGVGGTWATEVVKSHLFSGIHLDIEPPNVQVGNSNPFPEEAQLLTDFKIIRKRARGLPINADIAAWFYLVPTASGSTFDRAVMHLVNAVTITDYRNTVAGVLVGAKPELQDAKAVGTRLWIGINTENVPELAETFYGETAQQLLATIQQIDTQASAFGQTYAGLGIEDSTSVPTS